MVCLALNEAYQAARVSKPRRQVADAAIDHAEERDDRGLVRRDRVQIAKWLLLLARGADVWFALNSGARADIPGPPLWVDFVEKVENTAKTKFSQKLAGGRLLLRMRSSREERSPKVDVVHRVWPR